MVKALFAMRPRAALRVKPYFKRALRSRIACGVRDDRVGGVAPSFVTPLRGPQDEDAA